MCTNVTLVQNSEGLYSYLLPNKTASLRIKKGGGVFVFFLFERFFFPAMIDL